MAKRRLKKVPRVEDLTDSLAALRKALAKRKKAELVDLLVNLVEEDRRLLRQLMESLPVATPPEALTAATRQAIIDATDFDERDINRNFDYDYNAYSEVKRNLSRLIGLGQWPSAMELSLELMKAGSYQVEMSDEGLMVEDIEDCLNVVFKAVEKCDLPAPKIFTWCCEMLESDRVGCIARPQLQSLRQKFHTSSTR